MTNRALIVMLAFLSSVGSGAVGNEDLYGTWRLLASRACRGNRREERRFWKAPHGFLSYGRDGRMSAILAKDGRPERPIWRS